jgi:hypothetical protein
MREAMKVLRILQITETYPRRAFKSEVDEKNKRRQQFDPFPFFFFPFSLHSVVRWLEIFPREQLLLVNGDQLIEDPLSQIRRIEDFLGKL